MKLLEFIEQLQKYADIGHGDDEVCVRMTGCLSSCTANPVISVSPGFDWEKGKIMISTKDPAERYFTQKQKEEQQRKNQELKNKLYFE